MIDARVGVKYLDYESLATSEWQRIENEIDAALIFTRADFVNVHHFRRGSRFTITGNRTARKIVCKTSRFTPIWLLATKNCACACRNRR